MYENYFENDLGKSSVLDFDESKWVNINLIAEKIEAKFKKKM